MSSTFCRQTYDSYLLLGHYACGNALKELETATTVHYRSPVQAAFDIHGIIYLLELLETPANRIRLRFICYAFSLENNTPEEVSLFCNAQAEAYLAIRHPRKGSSFKWTDSFPAKFVKVLIFPPALIAEEFFGN